MSHTPTARYAPGGVRGRRIVGADMPLSDAPIEKGLVSHVRAHRSVYIPTALGTAGAVWTSSPQFKRMRQKAKIGGAMGRSSAEFRAAPRAERKALINRATADYNKTGGHTRQTKDVSDVGKAMSFSPEAVRSATGMRAAGRDAHLVADKARMVRGRRGWLERATGVGKAVNFGRAARVGGKPYTRPLKFGEHLDTRVKREDPAFAARNKAAWDSRRRPARGSAPSSGNYALHAGEQASPSTASPKYKIPQLPSEQWMASRYAQDAAWNRARSFGKAARYYDGEHRRQRRLGMYTAAAGLAGGALLAHGGRGLVKDTRKLRALDLDKVKARGVASQGQLPGFAAASPRRISGYPEGKHAVAVRPRNAASVVGGTVAITGAGVIRQKAEGRKLGIWR